MFNATPAQSLSIVDLQAQQTTAELQTPGCSLVYPAGARRFFMLCADGAALVVTLLIGYPVAFALAAVGIAFPVASTTTLLRMLLLEPQK